MTDFQKCKGMNPIDDYAKNGGPGGGGSLCTWIKTTDNKFAISNHTALILRVCVCSKKLFEAQGRIQPKI